MEPLTFFASTVGLIAVLHILFSAEKLFTRGIYYKGKTQRKRVDWYCFFQPSDLLGTTGNSTSQIVSENKNIEQRRQQQANRPRLQV